MSQALPTINESFKPGSLTEPGVCQAGWPGCSASPGNPPASTSPGLGIEITLPGWFTLVLSGTHLLAGTASILPAEPSPESQFYISLTAAYKIIKREKGFVSIRDFNKAFTKYFDFNTQSIQSKH